MNKTMKAAVLSILCAGLLASSFAEAAPRKLRAVSGTVGGVWYVGQSAMGKELTRAFPGLEYNLVAGGSVGNPIRINGGDGDISLPQKTNAIACQVPSDPYKKKLEKVRSLGVIGDSTPLYIVVRDDFPVRTLDELAEKKSAVRLSTGPNGTTSQSFGKWALEAYGISFDDIKRWGGRLFTNNYDDVCNMVKDGQIDMFFFVGPGEAGWIRDASLGVKLRLIPIPADKAEELEKKYGLSAAVHSGSMYDGKLSEGKDVPTVGDTSEFIVRGDMPDQDVYDILKACFDSWDNVVLAYPAWKSFTRENAWKNTGLPLHPGAEKFYREYGGMN